ncbi:MAG TPA: hypothetical protein VGV57_01755 [Thermoleophilaceae bacterium]|nr:hypothetical protein [Thermoleophilaceae bacterium]
MPKRLLVLVAVIAAFFVFAPTASAQESRLPDECTPDDFSRGECKAALQQLPLDGTVGDLLGEQGLLPGSCRGILNLDPAGTLTTEQLLRLLQCLGDLANLGQDEGDVGEPTAAGADTDYGYDGGYGYDLGYDIGYDGGVPEGGVDSGFGPTTGSDAAGAPPLARGAALLALLGVLTTGLLIMRRRAGS